MLLWQPTWYTWSTAAAHICCDLHEPTLLGKKRTLRSHRTSIHSQATLWLQSVRVQCRQRQRQIYMEPASKRRRAPSTSVHAGWLAFWKKPQKLNPFNLEWHGMTRNDAECITINNTKWHEMTRNDTQWHAMTRSDTDILGPSEAQRV